MATLISHSSAETEALGEAWGRIAQAGWVIGLCGELGAGKTQLVRGLACGLGSTQRVHSPTFTLVNVYGGGRLPLVHIDLYRLDTPQQIVAAGLEEYLRPAGVAVIEWAERWDAIQKLEADRRIRQPVAKIQKRLRWVEIAVLSDTERRIGYEDFGT